MFFVNTNSDLYSTSATAVMYTISCYIWPRYIGTQLFMLSGHFTFLAHGMMKCWEMKKKTWICFSKVMQHLRIISLWPCACMHIPAPLWRICKVWTTLAWWFIRWVNWDSLCLGADWIRAISWEFPFLTHHDFLCVFFTKADSLSYLTKFIIVTSHERHSVSNHG